MVTRAVVVELVARVVAVRALVVLARAAAAAAEMAQAGCSAEVAKALAGQEKEVEVVAARAPEAAAKATGTSHMHGIYTWHSLPPNCCCTKGSRLHDLGPTQKLSCTLQGG